MDPQTKSDIQKKLDKLRREGEERSAQRLAAEFRLPYVDILKTPISTDALKIIPEEEAREAKIAAVELKIGKVALVAANPKLPGTKKAIEDLINKKYEVKVFIASPSGLEEAWKLYRFVKKEAEEITGKVSINQKNLYDLSRRLKDLSSLKKEFEKFDFNKTTPTSILEVVFGGALSIKASDIHFEPEEKAVKIRLRIDGALHDIFQSLPLKNYEPLSSRIKLLAGLKINIHDEAQDGRFTINLGSGLAGGSHEQAGQESFKGGKDIEIRVSVIPSEYGETVVMRVLDPELTSIGLASLGLRGDDLEIAERALAKPNGLILNTGPTGSGKTTTLYAFLRHVNNPEIKIVTLEDPIEYRLEGVEQTQVDEEANYTFANGLRAIVRQDPDVILVGEIRDKDTADTAIQASLTGHVVLSTLHTNDAIGAIPRLLNLGVQPSSISSAINLVIAQRLVRRLCEFCKKEEKISGELRAKVKKFFGNLPGRVDRSGFEKYNIYKPSGCGKCNGFGYKGRIGIFEFFDCGPELEEVILKNLSELALKKLSESKGMVTMQEDGILKVLKGETSIEEVESATGKIEW